MLKDPSHSQLKVLITAGASGIGLVMARGFMQAGARVFVCDVNGAALAQAQHELPGLQGCVADVANEASVQSMLGQVEQALEELKAGMPQGLAAPQVLFRQADFIGASIGNVT